MGRQHYLALKCFQDRREAERLTGLAAAAPQRHFVPASKESRAIARLRQEAENRARHGDRPTRRRPDPNAPQN